MHFDYPPYKDENNSTLAAFAISSFLIYWIFDGKSVLFFLMYYYFFFVFIFGYILSPISELISNCRKWLTFISIGFFAFGFVFVLNQKLEIGEYVVSICEDGSFSESTGRGTCSWHGGVHRTIKDYIYHSADFFGSLKFYAHYYMGYTVFSLLLMIFTVTIISNKHIDFPKKSSIKNESFAVRSAREKRIACILVTGALEVALGSVLIIGAPASGMLFAIGISSISILVCDVLFESFDRSKIFFTFATIFGLLFAWFMYQSVEPRTVQIPLDSPPSFMCEYGKASNFDCRLNLKITSMLNVKENEQGYLSLLAYLHGDRMRYIVFLFMLFFLAPVGPLFSEYIAKSERER